MARQWSVDEVMIMARSCQPACVLFTAAELDIFTVLSKKPMSANQLANRLKADLRATTVLLDALVAIELLSKEDRQYHTPNCLSPILTEGGNQSILSGIRHQSNCIRRWIQLAEVVKTGRPAARTPSIRGEVADEEAFITAMNDFSWPLADKVIGHIGHLDFQCLLDIGGASGTWTIAFLQTVPQAQAILFDLPPVVKMAKKRIARAGLIKKVKFQSGDFYTDNLPTGIDFAWLSAIAHQNSREQNRELFKKIYNCLVKNGVLVIRDMVMDSSHTNPPAGALFAVNMLVSTPAGGTYSFDEYSHDLNTAGFSTISLVYRDEGMNSLIRAVKT
jgi:SAM-dependent methyltransferase